METCVHGTPVCSIVYYSSLLRMIPPETRGKSAPHLACGFYLFIYQRLTIDYIRMVSAAVSRIKLRNSASQFCKYSGGTSLGGSGLKSRTPRLFGIPVAPY